MDEYLQRRFGLSVSARPFQGGVGQSMIAEIKESNRPGGERPPGRPSAV